jgi:hypothetical protein
LHGFVRTLDYWSREEEWGMKAKLFAAVAAALITYAGAAHAATPIVMISNWDDAPTGLAVANPVVSGIGSWTGTPLIDVVADNTFAIRCAGNAGKCVDLAGTPGAVGGTFTSNVLNAANSTVTVQFLYSGAQRGIAGAMFLAELVNASNGAVVSSWASPALAATAPFTSQSLTGNVGSARQFQVRFTHLGGTSNVVFGAIIDNVSFSTVPEPSTWLLMIMGFGMIASQLRRRHVALAA